MLQYVFNRRIPLLRFFLTDRRPAAWNQWAEVVLPEPAEPVRYFAVTPVTEAPEVVRIGAIATVCSLKRPPFSRVCSAAVSANRLGSGRSYCPDGERSRPWNRSFAPW